MLPGTVCNIVYYMLFCKTVVFGYGYFYVSCKCPGIVLMTSTNFKVIIFMTLCVFVCA